MDWSTHDIPDQTGRIAIVTGANSGIGFATAEALVEKGARVVLACRSAEKGEDAVRRIGSRAGAGSAEFASLDLSSQRSIRSFAEDFQRENDRLDLLINNAGVMVPPYGKTEDGFELQLGTNHFGHFALTGMLLPSIDQAPNGRVVTVSSIAHRQGKIDFDDLHFERGYKKWAAYGQSKLANLLFAYDLQRRLVESGKKTVSIAAHPGWTGTNLQANSWLFLALNPLFSQPPSEGALPSLYAATSPDAAGGSYYGPGGRFEWTGSPKQVGSTGRSHDKDVADRLWQVSEKLTGVQFSL